MPCSTALQLLYAGSYRAPRGHDFPPHRHTCWEVVFYRKGHIEAPIGDEVFLARPGLLLCTPPGVVHSERALTAYVNDFITLQAPANMPWPRVVADDGLGTLSYLCRGFVAYARAATHEKDETMLQHWLAQFNHFLSSYREQVVSPAGEMLVRAAEQIFEERFATSFEVGDLAAELGIASSALRMYFARFRGYSPSEGLLRVRLQHAFALLRSSDLSLQAVAGASGFYSASHLSRHVKAATGQSPGQWRHHAR